MRQDTRNFGGQKGYALYDVLLAMFCNEWTWVSLKRIQIEKVERTREDYGPVGVWEKREKRCALAKGGQFVFRIIIGTWPLINYHP